MANSLVGIDITNTYTATQYTQGKAFGLNDRCAFHDGREFVFVVAGGAIAVSDVATFGAAASATALSTSNDARGNFCGVAPVAFASGEYGWLQVKGAGTVNVLASAVANVRLNTTATAGKLDDDGTVGSMQVQGIYITATNDGSTAAVACLINNPYVDVTL